MRAEKIDDVLMGLQSEFYSMFDVKTSKGEIVPSIFSVRDEKRHREMKKPIAAAYSLGTMKELEERCDACSEELMGKLESMPFIAIIILLHSLTCMPKAL